MLFLKYVYKSVEVICTDLHIFQKVYPFINTIQIPYHTDTIPEKFTSEILIEIEMEKGTILIMIY